MNLKELIKNRSKEDLTDKKVLVRSNGKVDEYDPLLIGTCTGYENLDGKASDPIPVVKREDGKERMCFGFVLPYSEDLENFLNQFSSKGQWELLSDVHYQMIENGEY